MAGSVTITPTYAKGAKRAYASHKVVFAWVAAGGAVSGQSTFHIDGIIQEIATIPGVSGVQPDDNYDIVINDENSIDIADGLLANRSESATQRVNPFDTVGLLTDYKRYVSSDLDVVVSNAGATNEGQVIILWTSSPGQIA